MNGFPLQDEIMTAVQNAATFISDPQLKRARLLVRQPFSGGFAMAFKVEADGRHYALRCWTQGIGDSQRHYEQIDRYLKQVKSKYFVDFKFINDGILVNGRRFPILRMDWLDADSLCQFIENNLRQPAYLGQAADAFLRLCASLHRHRIAHGDLQAENIKVVQRGPGFDFQLIDYDTMYVPDLGQRPVLNKGLDSYQHPRRSESAEMSEKDDYFSELVIYVSLRALAEQPELWRSYHRDDKDLLFNREDFSADQPTAAFQDLYRLSPLVQRLTVILWNFTRCPGIHLLRPLEEMVKHVEQHQEPPPPAETTTASSFDMLLRGKLKRSDIAGNGRTGGKAGDWLDDGAFHGEVEAKAAKPKKRTKKAAPPAMGGAKTAKPTKTKAQAEAPATDAFKSFIEKNRNRAKTPPPVQPVQPVPPTPPPVPVPPPPPPPPSSTAEKVVKAIFQVVGAIVALAWYIFLAIVVIALLSELLKWLGTQKHGR